jgi:hypothetical protein
MDSAIAPSGAGLMRLSQAAFFIKLARTILTLCRDYFSPCAVSGC